MANNEAFGKCKLTGAHGKFVKSHLIPEALNRRATNQPMLEVSDGDSRGIKRLTGWYDKSLVTAEGEAILGQLDNVAGRVFIGKDLLYRDRRTQNFKLKSDLSDGPSATVIKLGNDKALLHRFCISLLWRALETEMEYIKIRAGDRRDVEFARRFVVGELSPKWWDFPSYFGVFDDIDEIPKHGPQFIIQKGVRFLRFFLDGLVCYVSCKRRPLKTLSMGKMHVGKYDELGIFIHNSAQSKQAWDSRKSARKYLEKYGWPGIWKDFRG